MAQHGDGASAATWPGPARPARRPRALPALALALAAAATAGCLELKRPDSSSFIPTDPVPETCFDRARDGDESDVDCGGSCGGCGYGQRCNAYSDCAAGGCVAGTCTPTSGSLCYDRARDGDESDVDCGGSCPRCGAGKRCSVDAECASARCAAGTCSSGSPFQLEPARFALSGGRGALALAVADLDGDQLPDAVVGNLASGDVGVLRGNGDGSFADATTYPVGDLPGWVGVADLTSDGRPDLVVLLQGAAPTVAVLPNVGGGRFGLPRTVGATPAFLSAALVDLEGDGRVDLVASDARAAPLIFAGNGDGSFARPRAASAPDASDGSNPYLFLAAGDLDGDGRPDLCASGPPLRLLRGANLGSSDVAQPVGLNGPLALGLFDLRAAGRLDVVGVSPDEGLLQIWLGQGGGRLQEGQQLRVGNQPAVVVAADLDGDGHLDLATGNQGANDLSLLRGKGDGTFDTAVQLWVGGSLQRLVAADVNRDGKPDLVLTDYFSHDVGVLLNSHP